MTINDPDLNAGCLKVRQLSERLPILQREGQELALFIALSDIEKAAHEAQDRMNKLRYANNGS